jgi:predicted nucleotidyltransferase
MSNVIGPDGLSGCFRCFFVWRPRSPEPTRCPRCKSPLWDVPKLTKIHRGGGLGIHEVLGPKRPEVLRLIEKNRARNPRVFGSVGRGTATAKSDLDLLVDFDDGASAFDQVGLIQDLEDLLGRKVDVTEARGLHWIVRPQALLEAVPL